MNRSVRADRRSVVLAAIIAGRCSRREPWRRNDPRRGAASVVGGAGDHSGTPGYTTPGAELNRAGEQAFWQRVYDFSRLAAGVTSTRCTFAAGTGIDQRQKTPLQNEHELDVGRPVATRLEAMNGLWRRAATHTSNSTGSPGTRSRLFA